MAHLTHQLSKDKILEPRLFLKVISGTVAACVLTFGLVLVIVAQPYQNNLDLRQQAATTGLDCNQTCASSDDCEINLRCYQVGSESKCRLAINPSSSTCQATDLSSEDSFNTGSTKGGLDPLSSPSYSNPNSVTITPRQEKPVASTSPNLIDENLVSAETETETTPSPTSNQNSWYSPVIAWWSELISPDQSNTRRMLIVILSVGLILIGSTIILSAKGKKTHHQIKNSSDKAQDTKSDQVELDTPPPSTLSTSPSTSQLAESPSSPESHQSVPPAISSAQFYPSGGMTTRLKQKGVVPPK